MADINDLIRKRNEIIERGNEILDKAQAEDRDLTDEEQTNFDKSVEDSQRLKKQIDGLYTMGHTIPEPGPVAGNRDENGEDRTDEPDEAEQRAAAFRAWLRDGDAGLTAEQRALAVLPDTSGGYTQPPEQFVTDLIKAADNETFMRQLCTKYSLPKAVSLGAASLTDVGDVTWTTELLIGSEDSTMAFGRRELVPHPLARYIKVSNTLLRKSAIDVEALVRERLAYKMGTVQENAFLNGNGASQPLGIFTASAQGVNTGQDASTGNTTTSITTDGLITAYHLLNSKYRKDAIWVFHDDAIQQIRKLKDGEGNYIWRPGLTMDRPDAILGRPIYTSAYAPNTFTAGLYVGALFVPRYYWIVDSLDFRLQRLDELYAATNQTGYVVRAEVDGCPILEQGFVRVTLAT